MCRSLDEAAGRLREGNLAYVGLEDICPPVDALFDLRPLLGLRSAVNSFARELNPFRAPHQIQGVFHPPYLPLHQETARLLGQPQAAIFKGGGGEAQRNPEKPCRVSIVSAGDCYDEEWPALTPGEGYPWRNEPLEIERIAALWRGDLEAEAPAAAVVGTAAIALKLIGRARGIEEAQEMAWGMWADRPREKHGQLLDLSA
jgi:anthranilate phosphoribosyltransferase